jgi:2,4-dienoyl-CoA reductase-like NADH-dependent reductase (Old Yellow Enzyme family)
MKRALRPLRLAGLTLRNRVIKTATYEGMSRGGIPSPALTEHHVALARGGVGMTTLAYVAVSPHGRTFADQLVMHDELVAQLRPLTDAVHEAGAAVSIQLGHCGGFSKDLTQRRHDPPGPLGPSRAINLYGVLQGLAFTKPMREVDIEAIPQQFALAATRARAAGFDAIELHLGHGYLLSQFLSPAINRRRDRYGGSLENRLRLPLAVVRAVRAAVGPQFPILCKTNLRDDIRGGLELDEAVEIAKALEREGVDALVLSGGFVSHSPFYLLRGARPLREMIAVERKPMQRMALRVFGPSVIAAHPFEPLFFLPLAREVRRAVSMPLCLLGGVVSGDNLASAMDEGFELVAMGRALLENPNFVRDLDAGLVEKSSCTHCNVCVAEMDRDGVRCVLPVGRLRAHASTTPARLVPP